MPAEVANLLAAAWALVVYGLTQPWIGPLVAGVFGGYSLAAAKNRTALIEIGRAVFIGGMAWLFVSAAQALIAGGAL